MLSIVISVFEKICEALAKQFGSEVFKRKPQMCKGLIRLYFGLDELLQLATKAYSSFESVPGMPKSQRDDPEFGYRIRREVRDMLESLKRFEDLLKELFATLKLVGGEDLSISLVQIPEASYSLFKRHFVEDLAPQFVADKEARKYILRITVKKKDCELIAVDRLGRLSLDLQQLNDDGAIGFDLINFEDTEKLAAVLADCRRDLLRLRATQSHLGKIIKENCELANVL